MEEMTLTIVNAQGEELQRCTGPGPLRMVYRAAYQPGDALVLDCGAPGRFVAVQWEDTMPPALLYAEARQIRFLIPFGEQAITYSPKSFTGDCQVVRARPARPEELAARRNLAFNPYDQHESTGCYPHAAANVETRGEAVFAARNAIDGVYENAGHGVWPFQSWGINRDPQAAMTLFFGRPVTVDELRLTLRADFPHDSWWTAATVRFSDGSREVLDLCKSDQPQAFAIAPRTVTSLTLCELRKDAGDPSPFPALTQLEAWGAEAAR